MNDTYKTISSESEGAHKDKGSKFIAYAFPVHSETEAKETISRVRKEHHSARHHCFAWRIGFDEPAVRINDDGEPSSTAGRPILGQLLSFDVTNVLVVVVRYFGGTLLGTAGLINAYRTATFNALQNSTILTKIVEECFVVDFGYPAMNSVMQLVKQENLHVVSTCFEITCQLKFLVRKSEAEKTSSSFRLLPGVKIKKAKHRDSFC